MTYDGPDHFADVLEGMQDIDSAIEDLEHEANVSQQELNYIQNRTQQLQDQIQQGRDTAQAIADYEQDIANQIDSVNTNQIIATVSNNGNTGEKRRGFLWKAAILGGALVGAGAVGNELLEEDGVQKPQKDGEQVDYNISNLAANNFLEGPEGEPSGENYEGWEIIYEEIGNIAAEWSEDNIQFGYDVREEWLNTSSDLKLGLSSVKVESTAEGPRLRYEQDNPDGYIGQLMDFENDIKTSTVFNSRQNYQKALEVMKES